MNIPFDHLVGSVLKVTASEKLDISKDLLATEKVSLAQLLEDHKEKTSEKENQEISENS